MKKTFIFISCFIFFHSAAADTNAAKLKSLSSQISKVKTELTQKRKQHTSIEQQLADLEKKIVVLERRYKDTVKNFKQRKATLAKLNKDQAKQQRSLEGAQKELSNQINLAYQLRPSNYFKIILKKGKKMKEGLLLDYHKYIFAERLKQMRNISATLELIEKNRKDIKRRTKELEGIERKQKRQKLELEKTKKKRSEVSNSLKTKIDKDDKKLKQLLAAKSNLEKLVNKLNIQLRGDMPAAIKAKVCKDFVWPTKGKVIIRFGSPIEQSSWKWNGVVIEAPENQQVRAISSGKVIYADKLSGYGLLLIIDHGNGYISLYGYNNKLYTRLNSIVKAGEVIAAVGRGDDKESTLYFAIRYNGNPVDPQKWCR